MKSILVIGLGRFGLRLAEKMSELGNDVMAVDTNKTIIEDRADEFTEAIVADCTRESVLKELGVSEFDICYVCIGTNFQASLQITSLLKDLGAKRVISKAGSDIHAKFLLRNGADEIVYPEMEMAEKLAIRHNARNMFDFIELNDKYGVFEISAPESWTGKSIRALDVRSRFKVNILAIKYQNGDLFPLPSADYIFEPSSTIVVVGTNEDVQKLTGKN
ncbi:MAG: potassium channel family protein [Eubacteriales bacterium]